MRKPTVVPLWLVGGLLAALTLACASSSPRRTAGTGDLAFRLIWEGISDLDLFVVDPAGTCMFWGSRDAPSGGLLDIDCNAASDRMCGAPIENVFWQKATAPAGTYLFWVQAQTVIPDEQPVAFEIQLLRGTEVVWRTASSFFEQDRPFGPLAVDFPGKIAPRPTTSQLPPCIINRPDSSLHGMVIEPRQPYPVLPPGSLEQIPEPEPPPGTEPP